MNLELTDTETAVLLKELNDIIDGDRYFLSTRIKTLKAIRAKIRPEPVREPLPPLPRRYEPPRATAAQKRQGTLNSLPIVTRSGFPTDCRIYCAWTFGR